MTISDLIVLRFVQIVFSFSGGIIGLLNWESLRYPLKVFCVQLFLSGFFELLTYILFKNGINPNPAVYISGLIEIVLTVWFYILIFNKREARLIIALTGLGVTLFYILNWLFLQRSNMNSYSIGLQLFAELVLGLYFYYYLLRRLPNIRVSKSGIFWINTGMVIYTSGALFLFLLADYLINVLKNDMIAFSSVNNILLVIANAIYLVGMWYGIREGKIKQESI